jgi:hypothetical protein
MAWIAQAPPSPRHPKPRWQVRYQDGTRQRSAGIYTAPKVAEAARRRIDRGLPPGLEDVPAGIASLAKAGSLFGDYVPTVWWPTWKAQHPDSAYNVGKRIEKWILPVFGNIPFAALDADRIGCWKPRLLADGLQPSTVNTYLSLLGTILNGRSTATICPTPAHAQEPCRTGRRRQEHAGQATGGLDHPCPARLPRHGDRRLGDGPSRWTRRAATCSAAMRTSSEARGVTCFTKGCGAGRGRLRCRGPAWLRWCRWLGP